MAKKILLVDDEPHIIELEKAILTLEGFEILTAEDGATALEILKTEKPDLVILDMMMPGMSGRETCDSIRKNPKTKDLKVIFVTVAKFSEMGQKSLEELGVSDYLTKPFDNDELVARVKKALK
jgi:DNA-binding response OmpR family regulator